MRTGTGTGIAKARRIGGKMDKNRERIRVLREQGMSGKEIAEATGLSVHTVHNYMGEILCLKSKKQNRQYGRSEIPRELWNEYVDVVNVGRMWQGKEPFKKLSK